MASRPDGDVLDAKTLEGLRLLEESTGAPLLADLTRTFREDAPQRIALLREALGAGDAGSVAIGAHSIRGSAGALGAMRLHATATQLEEAAESGSLEGCGALVDALESDTARAIDALERVARVSVRSP
jgi:HPt (histidine-containing phosphotransfer) domain-containing protein